MPTAATMCLTIALSVLAPAAVAATVTSDRPPLAASANPAIADEQWNALVRHALLDDAVDPDWRSLRPWRRAA